MLPATLPTLNETRTTPPSAGPLLLFEQVSKWYGSVLGVNQVTLELRGGITGLVGANGAGKSTLMKLATGQVRPTLGRVSVRGQDAWHWRARNLVGYCPDTDAFYEELSGREFVLQMAKLSGFRTADAKKRTDAILEQVGMADRANRKLRGYSKGMRQRVKLAQALLTDPVLLVLDEPLSGIDPIGRQELLELFLQLAADGKCLLVSSHELEELEKLTNHVVVMARGRVAAVGTLDRIRATLEKYPLSVRIRCGHPRRVAEKLFGVACVVGVDLESESSLCVRATTPAVFFDAFARIVVEHDLEIETLEPLDDSAHAILGYLLGGSGKT